MEANIEEKTKPDLEANAKRNEQKYIEHRTQRQKHIQEHTREASTNSRLAFGVEGLSVKSEFDLFWCIVSKFCIKLQLLGKLIAPTSFPFFSVRLNTAAS
jgi:hypothetical protein